MHSFNAYYGNWSEKNPIKLHNRRLTLDTAEKAKHAIANYIVLWA